MSKGSLLARSFCESILFLHLKALRGGELRLFLWEWSHRKSALRFTERARFACNFARFTERARFACNFQDWGCVILREIDFLLKICWSIPCLHPSWKVHTWKVTTSCDVLRLTFYTKELFHNLKQVFVNWSRINLRTTALIFKYDMLCHFKNYSQDSLFYVITLPLESYMFQIIINFQC